MYTASPKKTPLESLNNINNITVPGVHIMSVVPLNHTCDWKVFSRLVLKHTNSQASINVCVCVYIYTDYKQMSATNRAWRQKFLCRSSVSLLVASDEHDSSVMNKVDNHQISQNNFSAQHPRCTASFK